MAAWQRIALTACNDNLDLNNIRVVLRTETLREEIL
jgi:hypothetical protein